MCHQNFEPLHHSGLSSVYARGVMSNLEKVLINPSNKRSYVLCSQGSSKLKRLVRGRSLVLIIVAELWQRTRSEGELNARKGEGRTTGMLRSKVFFTFGVTERNWQKWGHLVQKKQCMRTGGEGRTKTRAVPAPTPQTPRLPDHRFAVCEIVNRWHGTEKWKDVHRG